MEGSDYEDKCSQRADDVERMSNREKRKDKSKKKRIGVNHNSICKSGQCLIHLFCKSILFQSVGCRKFLYCPIHM